MDNELFKDAGKAKTQAEAEKKAPESEKAPEKVDVAKAVEKTAEVQQEATDNSNGEDEQKAQMPDELTMLKSRAKLMGVAFSNNIGLDALKEKIEEHKQKSATADNLKNAQAKDAEQNQIDQKEERQTAKVKKVSLRSHLQKEKMKLIRLRITNLDPKKKDLPGEILTTGNEYLGTVRKFVPFGEQTDEGFHVPYCLYELMRDRKFLSIKTRKGPKGQTIVEQQMVREFALEILPPLTEKELANLSSAQLAAGSVER